MKRPSIARFIQTGGDDRTLLMESAAEIQAYARCLKKKGASCPIMLTGVGSEWRLRLQDVQSLLCIFLESDLLSEALDYIVNGLLLDEITIKDPEAEELLEDAAAILSDVRSPSQLHRELRDALAATQARLRS